MSDEWNNNQQNNDWNQNNHNHDQPHGDHQHDQGYQQPEHQHFEPAHEPLVEATHEPVVEAAHESAAAAPSPELLRLDAIEAAIHELRAHIDDLKTSLTAPSAAKPTEGAAEPVLETAAPEETAVAADPHGDRLAAIETEIGHVKTLVGSLAHTLTAIQSDVSSHATLHTETRDIIDEQHQLMRGLNYIITSAIGTLTASAKSVK